MQTVSLDAVRVAGALDLDVTDGGTVPRRLPAWTRHQIVDLQHELMITMPSGVRLELDSDTDAVELDVALTLLRFRGMPTISAVFDLVVDGEVVASAETAVGTIIDYDPVTGDVQFEPGEPTTVRFDGIRALGGGNGGDGGDGVDRGAGGGARRVEVWLPQRCVVQLGDLRVDDGATVTTPSDDGARRRWAHYGSSISHCLEADRPTGTWPAIAARTAGVDLVNLAVAGQCHLDQVVARTIRDLDVDLISLKLGINVINRDSFRERTFVPAVHGFLDTVRDGHPTTPLVLVTPIVCPVAEDHPGPTQPGPDGTITVPERPPALAEGALSLGRIRTLLSEIVAARQVHGDRHLHLLDGLALFGHDDASGLPDGLHPDAVGYRRIGERFGDLVFAAGGPFSPEVGQTGSPR